MPRGARILIDGGTYHVLTRGNNGQTVFHHDSDCQRYLQLLSEHLRHYQLKLYHFVLMPNHVHFVLEVPEASHLSRAMHGLNLSYALFHQKRHRYSGHLWQGRFKSLPIDKENDVLQCGRYIELNPVRAGLVSDPQAYPWSSYRVHAEGADHSLVTPSPLYELLGSSGKERQERYRQFVREGADGFNLAAMGRRRGRPRKTEAAAPRKMQASPFFGGVRLGLLLMNLLLTSQLEIVFAQMSNGSYTLQQEMVSSAGGQIGGGNPMRAETALGLPAAGLALNSSFRLIGGIGSASAPVAPPVTTPITVTGTVTDLSAISTVTVNGELAAVVGSVFSRDNVLLVAGPNTVAVIATDVLGHTATKSALVYLDLPPAQKTPRFSITVTGTINDAGATVAVNGVAASVASGQFTASDIPLVNGLNTLTATATDAAGNTATTSMKVFVPLPTRPPARPTVGTVGAPLPDVTTVSSLAIGGTKTADTSIWINGAQVYARDDQTTWAATVALIEGDNEWRVSAKDALGTESASNTVNVIVDNLPPVVTFSPPTKTNFNPALLLGSVDDSRTVVQINGITATRTKRDFEASVPLILGSNTLQLEAISPNGYRTTLTKTVVLGTIPTVQSVTPADGVKVYASQTASCTVTATDQENDPIEYRVLIDGAVLSDWRSSATAPWTPSLTQTGSHTITVNARDAYGGSSARDVDVYVVRLPIEHP